MFSLEDTQVEPNTKTTLLVTTLLVSMYLLLLQHVGPEHLMTPRRKLMMASYSAPSTGIVQGSMELDMTHALAYISTLPCHDGCQVTITHLFAKVVGLAIKKTGMDGRIALGAFRQTRTVDVACIVATSKGRGQGTVKLTSVDELSLESIARKVKDKRNAIRQGIKGGADADDSRMLYIFPLFMIKPALHLVGYLSGALGIPIGWLGVDAHPFGSALVTSVGMMGLDMAFSPLLPWAHVPLLVTLGGVSDKPIVVNKDIVVRPMMTVTVVLDHRYLEDATQAGLVSKQIRHYITHPEAIFQD